LRGGILPGRIDKLLLSVRRTTRSTGTTGTTRTTRATIGTRTTRAAITTRSAWSSRTTGAHLVARTTRTTATWAATTRTAARTTRTTRTTGTTTATIAIATSAARTTTTWTALVTRCGRQLPADARARHLAATRTIVFLLLFLRARRFDEAAEATRLVAIATRTTRAAGTTATATTAIATTAAATTTAITAAATTIVAACTAAITTARRGNAIDHVVKLAARDGAVRTRFALEHANETNLIDAITDDVERLEQTRGAIGLNTERARNGIDRRIGRSGRSRCRFGTRVAGRLATRFGACVTTGFGSCFAARFGSRFAACFSCCVYATFRRRSGIRALT
jgi:hypothetical protein